MRLVLYYAKGCDWEDAVVTDFKERKPGGGYKHGILPLLTLPDGKEMTHTAAIARYLGKVYPG